MDAAYAKPKTGKLELTLEKLRPMSSLSGLSNGVLAAFLWLVFSQHAHIT